MSTLCITRRRVAQLVDIEEAESCLLLRSDFEACGPSQEVTSALDELVASGRLAQLRADAYAYVECFAISEKLLLRWTLQDLGREYAL